MQKQDSSRFRGSLTAFAVIFAGLLISHLPLLRLPYFWDEAGYFIPAALDLLGGSFIPQSTLSNAHPPLVMAWLAFIWKLTAFTPLITRIAMLLVAAFALTAVWRLSRAAAGRQVAIATVVCTALYPVFFVQSSLAHLDVMAGALTLWGLFYYIERRRILALLFFALAPLAKETALATPLALFGWELVSRFLPEKISGKPLPVRQTAGLLLCAIPIVLWLGYHRLETGYLFGNPDYLRYNLGSTLAPLRILMASLIRTGQLLAYLNIFVLTISAGYALSRPALIGKDGSERPGIQLNIQAIFAVIILAYLALLSIAGGAMLARYFIPVYPLVILICVATLQRRIRLWKWWIAVACIAFILALIAPPPYRVAPEDTLLYRDFILLHKRAADALAARYPDARVLTAWPASGELSWPSLGYAARPARVAMRLENFSESEMVRAAQAVDQFDIALLFSTKWEPPHPIFSKLIFGKELQERFFDYHKDVTPKRAAEILGGRILEEYHQNNEWVALIAVGK